MADSILYLLRSAPGHDADWREAVEMALTGAAFGVATTVWLGPAPLAQLARRADANQMLGELTGFGVRCVAAQRDLPPTPNTALADVEALDDEALGSLRAACDQLVVL